MNGTRGRQTRRFVRDAAGGGGARRVTTMRPCRSEARADGRSGNRPSLAFAGSRSTGFTDAGAEPSGPRLSAAPLLNHCGIRSDLLTYTLDRSPHEHGLYLPGTHIPILPPETIADDRPDRADRLTVQPCRRARRSTASAPLPPPYHFGACRDPKQVTP